jgi:hypothetical protein
MHPKRALSCFAATAILALASAAPALAEPIAVPLDTETTLNGIPVACTGVGEAKLNPHWKTYGVLVEFSGPGGELLGDETLRITDAKGDPVVSIACEGPWILLTLPPGTYRVEGRLTGTDAKPQTGYFKPSHGGQSRLELSFPDAS